MKKTFRHETAAPREVHDEIEFHLAMRTREYIEQGMTPDEARAAARASFGDVTSIEAELRADRRDRDGVVQRREWWASVAQDVRHSVRGLLRRPLFALSTIAALAIGIGAAGAVFAIVNGVLLRPLPYAQPQSLTMVWMRMPSEMGGGAVPISSGFFEMLRTQAKSYSSMAAFRSSPGTLGEGDETERIAGVRTTPQLFATLGVRPVVGRTFVATDADSGAAPVTILSWPVWQRRFGGDRGVIGRRVNVSGKMHEVVGVMPQGFSFPRGAELMSGLQFPRNTELWTPMEMTARDRQNYGTQNLALVARLVPGVTPAAAEEEFNAMVAAFLRDNNWKAEIKTSVVTLRDQAAQPVERGLLLLLGAVVVVLLIACANVAALLAARVSERHRELAVRMALGARPSRLGRQLVTEMLVLAVAGGIGGALGTWGGTRILLALVPGNLPRSDDISVGLAVLLAVGAVSVLCGLAFGVICSRRVRTSDAAEALRGSARSTEGFGVRRGRRLLVGAQVALSVLLLVGAGLLLRSFGNLQAIRHGFTPSGAITGHLNIPVAGAFNPGRDGPEWARFFGTVVSRVGQLPGVDAAGASSGLPLGGTTEGGGFVIVGREPSRPEDTPRTAYVVAEGAYFKAAGIALLSGRPFEPADRSDAPHVAIISRSLADKYFPGQSALGQQIRTTFEFGPNPEPRTIVGVVDDVKHWNIDGEVTPTTYVPDQQMSYPGLELVVRTSLPMDAVMPMVKREVRAAHPSATFSEVRPLADLLRQSLSRQRFTLTLIGSFAAAALVLAVVGLYGVIAMSVQARRHELGVRLALGARPSSLVTMVLGEGMRLAGFGVVVGVLGALGLSGVMRALLYGVGTRDAVVFVSAALVVVGVAALASWVPARRASLGNPTEALRTD